MNKITSHCKVVQIESALIGSGSIQPLSFMPYPSYFCRIPKLDDEEKTDQCLLGVANSLMGFFDEHLIMSSEEQTTKYKVRDTN